MPETSDVNVQRLVKLLYRDTLTLIQISEKMNYPVTSVLFLINRARAAGFTLFAHPTVPFTTFSFIPPKEAE
jgi:hypothetical protein